MYIPKDPWGVCDRCGRYYRHSELRKEWTGLLVCKRGCFESRHPQDFVQGVPDNISIEDARPDVDETILTTTLSSGASKDDITIDVTSASGIEQYSAIGVKLNDGTVFQTYTNTAVAGTTVTLGTALWGTADAGNTVYIYSSTNDTYLDSDLTGSDY